MLVAQQPKLVGTVPHEACAHSSRKACLPLGERQGVFRSSTMAYRGGGGGTIEEKQASVSTYKGKQINKNCPW